MRWARHAMSCLMLLLAVVARATGEQCDHWPGWQRFKQYYLSPDGRVIDMGTPQSLTVSEGQAYGLTFALIANDPEAFTKILRWTANNLAGGDLAHSLPAWQWGRAADGTWRILDRNSAADADLWMDYALFEAARLWHKDEYEQLASALAELILREEVAVIPGLGSTLLPGPRGFVSQQTWRLNASYVPLQVLRVVQRRSRNQRWADVLASSLRVIVESAPRGYAADWIQYRESAGFGPDAGTHGVGSYDAIRVYLWAGMLAQDDPQGSVLAHKLAPMADRAFTQPPAEVIDTLTLATRGQAPPGFLAALLPLLARFKYAGVVESYRERVLAETLTSDQHYYGDALSLFGLGWLEGRFRFDRHGELRVQWTGPCPAG